MTDPDLPDPIILRIRRLGDVGTELSDEQILEIYEDEGEDIDAAIAGVWEAKAAQYAKLVDISEAGSSRSNSALYKNAMEMAKYWRAKAAADDPVPTPTVRGSYVRPIERT